MATVTVTVGDLVTQDAVDAVVKAWNRNLLPASRFTITGVSRAILDGAGLAPFQELRRAGILAVGDAVGATAAEGDRGRRWDRLPASASLGSVQRSVRSALRITEEHDLQPSAFRCSAPGTVDATPEQSLVTMVDEQGTDISERQHRVIRCEVAT
jgi:hypothetical protein